MTDGDLAELVSALRSFGTDVANVEAKRAQDALPRSVRDTLSSFSNTAGGVIVLGLDEEHGFIANGVAQPKRVADALTSLAANEMDPPLRPLIMLHRFEDAVVITAEVPELEPGQKPCYYRGAGMTRGSFVRVGDSDRLLSPYEVQLLVASRGQPREDEESVAVATAEALDRGLVERFCERLRSTRPSFRTLDDREVLRRSRVLLRDAAGVERASLAGLLALGAFPQEFFPQLNLTFVHYPTTTGAPVQGQRFLDNASLDGPIPVIVRDALMTLRKNMTRRAVIVGAGREDVWEYPELALREAVVNALVHRDLSPHSRGTKVQIEMYPDRLHIGNAGGLFGPITVDRLGGEGISAARNALLMRILEDVSFIDEPRMVCENRGSGVRTMIQALRDAGMTPPVFDNRIATFHVTFPNHTLMSDRTVRWIGALGDASLTDSQALAPDGGALAARRLPPADRRNEILQALGDRTLSRSEIAALTGLPNQTVGRWLGILRLEGRIEVTTGSPRSKLARYRGRPEPTQGTLFGC